MKGASYTQGDTMHSPPRVSPSVATTLLTSVYLAVAINGAVAYWLLLIHDQLFVY